MLADSSIPPLKVISKTVPLLGVTDSTTACVPPESLKLDVVALIMGSENVAVKTSLSAFVGEASGSFISRLTNSGRDLSIFTLLLSVVAVTAAPALPASS